MVTRRKLEEIAARKEFIRAQCEIHRCIIALEGQVITEKFRWMDTTSRWLGQLRPALPLVAAVGGIFVAQRGGRVLKLVSRAMVGYRIVRAFMKR